TVILKIKRTRFIHAIEKHERMSADGVEPELVRRQGDRLVGGFERPAEIAGQDEDGSYSTDPADAELEVILPLYVVGIGRGEALYNGEGVAIGLERLLELALRLQHVAKPVIRDRQITLPQRIAGIGSGEALGDGVAVTIGLERLIKLALRHQHLADLAVRDRQIALPLRIAGIGGDEALGDGETIAVGFECLIELALRLQQGANLINIRRQQI